MLVAAASVARLSPSGLLTSDTNVHPMRATDPRASNATAVICARLRGTREAVTVSRSSSSSGSAPDAMPRRLSGLSGAPSRAARLQRRTPASARTARSQAPALARPEKEAMQPECSAERRQSRAGRGPPRSLETGRRASSPRPPSSPVRGPLRLPTLLPMLRRALPPNQTAGLDLDSSRVGARAELALTSDPRAATRASLTRVDRRAQRHGARARARPGRSRALPPRAVPHRSPAVSGTRARPPLDPR